MNDKKKDVAQTTWNDALGYLQTIDWLIRCAHAASVDDDDVYDWLMYIEQLAIEVAGQYFAKEDEKVVDEMEDKRKEVIKNLIVKQQEYFKKSRYSKQAYLIECREVVRPYHLLVNKYAHVKGLRMGAKEHLDIAQLV